MFVTLYPFESLSRYFCRMFSCLDLHRSWVHAVGCWERRDLVRPENEEDHGSLLVFSLVSLVPEKFGSVCSMPTTKLPDAKS